MHIYIYIYIYTCMYVSTKKNRHRESAAELLKIARFLPPWFLACPSQADTWPMIGNVYLSCDVIVVNHCSHQVIVFE